MKTLKRLQDSVTYLNLKNQHLESENRKIKRAYDVAIEEIIRLKTKLKEGTYETKRSSKGRET